MDHRVQNLTEQSNEFNHHGGRKMIVSLSGVKFGHFYKGSYDDLDSVNTVKFLKYDDTPENTTLCDKIVYLSEKADCPFILAPECVATASDGSLLLGYRFAKLVEQVKTGAFDCDDGTMDFNTRLQIRNLLGSIEVMHDNNVFHDNLKDPKNYVYSKQLIHIIAPTIDGDERPLETETLRINDLRGFAEFLPLICRVVGFKSKDWNHFMKLFKNETIHIRGLLNHPVFMDDGEKVEYFRNWYDCCYTKKDNPGRNLLFSHLEVELPFKSWTSRLTTEAFVSFLNSKKKVTYDNTLDGLLRFMRNLLKHYEKENQYAQFAMVGKEISKLFPGFFSALHVACVVTGLESYDIALD